VEGVTGADDITRVQATEIQQQKGGLTPEQEYKLERYYYVRLNGDSSEDLEELIQTPLKKLSRQIRAFEALTVQTGELIHRDQTFATEIIPDKQTLALQTDLRKRIETTYGGYEQEDDIEPEKLAVFSKFILDEAESIQRDLEFGVPENVSEQPIKTLNKYLKQFGLVAHQGSRTREDGLQERKYRIDSVSRDLMNRVAVRRQSKSRDTSVTDQDDLQAAD